MPTGGSRLLACSLACSLARPAHSLTHALTCSLTHSLVHGTWGLPPYPPPARQVEGCTRALQDGEELTIGSDVHVTCLHTPGYVRVLSVWVWVWVGGLASRE